MSSPKMGTATGHGRALKKLLATGAHTPTEVTNHFSGAKIDLVRRHLDILEVMGEVQKNPDGRYQGAA